MKQIKLWVFDFDGTLAPIGSNYRAAKIDPYCEEMLIMLVEKFPGRVAVASSRPLYDLAPRLPVPGLFIGAGNGLTWLLPGGEKKLFYADFKVQHNRIRGMLLPKVKELELLYGVDIEDKLTSCTLHVPHLEQQIQQAVYTTVRGWAALHGLETFQGLEAIEILFTPQSARVTLIQHFCDLLRLSPKAVDITYAGDDENDIPIMQWIIQHKGTVFNVGRKILVAGARLVKNPEHLAQETSRLLHGDAASAPYAVA